MNHSWNSQYIDQIAKPQKSPFRSHVRPGIEGWRTLKSHAWTMLSMTRPETETGMFRCGVILDKERALPLGIVKYRLDRRAGKYGAQHAVADKATDEARDDDLHSAIVHFFNSIAVNPRTGRDGPRGPGPRDRRGSGERLDALRGD